MRLTRTFKRSAAVVLAVVLLVGVTGTSALAEEAHTQQATFAVDGMTCGGCVGAVKIQLKRTPGVIEYDVSLDREEAVVTYDPEVTDTDTIAAAIAKAGFDATLK